MKRSRFSLQEWRYRVVPKTLALIVGMVWLVWRAHQ